MPIVQNKITPMRTTTREQHTTSTGIRIGSAYVPKLRADQAGWIDRPKRPFDPADRIVLAACGIAAILVIVFKLWR